MLTDELVQQYEQLWENGAPMEQIADFCRHHLQKINHQDKEETELFCILRKSYKWGSMTCMPMFLKHLKDDDDELLESFIVTGEKLVADVLRVEPETFEQSVTEQIRLAALYAVAYLYEHREDADHHALVLSLRYLLFGDRQVGF